MRLPFSNTSPVLPSPTVWCSACRSSPTSELLEHNLPLSFPGITFPEVADVLPSTLLIQGLFNPARPANKHTQPRHPLHDIRMEYDAEPFSILGIDQEDRHEDLSQRIRLRSVSESYFFNSGLHLWPVLLWDGVVEVLTNKISFPCSDFDIEMAVGIRMMVFEMCDQIGFVAYASGMQSVWRYTCVRLVVYCWDILYNLLRLSPIPGEYGSWADKEIHEITTARH